MQQLLRGVTYLLVLLMPFFVFFPFGLPADRNVFALYAQRGFYLSDVPLIFLLALTLIGEIPWRRGPLTVTGSLIGICVLAIVSIPQAISPPFAFYVAVRWLLALYLYFWFLQPVVSTKALAAAFAAGLALHVIVGMAQVAYQSPLNLPGELALPPEIPGAAVTLVDGARWLRAYGLAFHPNVLGGFLAVGLLLLTPWLERLHMIALWWLLWLGLALTFSRAAWIAIAVTMPLVMLALFLKRRRARARLALAVAGVVMIFLVFAWAAGEQIVSRMGPLVNYLYGSTERFPTTQLEERSLSERAALNDLAWEIIAEQPLQGVGAGNFSLTMPRLRPLMVAQSVHNVPLLLAAEVGLLGAAFWLIAGVTIGVRLILHWSKASSWLICASFAWLALLIISSFDSYPWALNSGLLLTAMVMGLASRAPRDRA